MSTDGSCASTNLDFELVRIAPSHPDFRFILETALEFDAPTGSASTLRILHDYNRRGVRTEFLLAAYAGARLINSVLLLENPGHSTFVACPGGLHSRDSCELWTSATTALLRKTLERSAERGSVLTQLLTPIGKCPICAAALSAGYRRLTRLAYLIREVNLPILKFQSDPNLDWISFDNDNTTLFERALESSYAQSMDCPELTGLRSLADVLAGHRATGDHDPGLWLVACCDGEPLGIILLSRHGDSKAIEVVYMGVAQPARGLGVGNALLRRGVLAARSVGANTLALAVDSRNAPARRLYERWGFQIHSFRDAWIATHDGARS